MDLPFLEISIISTTEQNLTHTEILTQIIQAFKSNFEKELKFVDQQKKPVIRREFSSLEEFTQLYGRGYIINDFILEQVRKEGLKFDFIESLSKRNTLTGKNPTGENYLVLFYHSNYLDPIKKNYRLATEFNRMIRCQVSYEEINTGFIRFVHTKEDHLSLLGTFDTLNDWENYFVQRNLDITHPTIQKFLIIIEKMLIKFH